MLLAWQSYVVVEPRNEFPSWVQARDWILVIFASVAHDYRYVTRLGWTL